MSASGLAPLELGATLRKVEPMVTVTDIAAYARASGDLNPIHLDDAAARAAGLPGVVVMGMLPAAFLARIASEWTGAALDSFSARFKKPVWPDLPLEVEARVEGLDAGNVTLSLLLTSGGEVCVTGTATGPVGAP